MLLILYPLGQVRHFLSISAPAPDRACDKTSDRLFSKLVLERAPSNDDCNFQKSSLDGALSKRGVENKRSEVLYQARSGADENPNTGTNGLTAKVEIDFGKAIISAAQD